MHECMHTYMLAFVRACMRTCVRACMRACIVQTTVVLERGSVFDRFFTVPHK